VFPTAAGEQHFITFKTNKMATFNKGILGGFTGKTGTVIGSNWKGRQVMRSLPGKKSRTSSADQRNQREKFSLMVRLFAGIADLLGVSFPAQSKTISGYNVAVSYNIHRAITGDATPFGLNYAEISIAKGNLISVPAPAAEAESGGGVRFSWTNNAQPGMPIKDEDTVTVAAYCPAADQWVYAQNVALRSDESVVLDTSVFGAETVETYLFLCSADGKRISDSVYTGSLLLTP
jgi:hypothetical protein